MPAHHSEKWNECFQEVQAKGHDESSAAAICTAKLGAQTQKKAPNEAAITAHVKSKQAAEQAAHERNIARKEKRTAEAMTEELREIRLLATLGEIRTAIFDGREHIVAPVVALVEGVLHAVNSPQPELVLAQEFSLGHTSWNGRPVMLNHPEVNGKKVSANHPTVLETSVGRAFNAKVDGRRLTMEAWIEPSKLEACGPDGVRTLERIKKSDPKDPIEVSVGVFMVAEKASGNKDGRNYSAIWRHITPDHLAILPSPKTGACSTSMGCGIRYMSSAEGFEELPAMVTSGERVLSAEEQRQLGDLPGHEFHGNQYTDASGGDRIERIGSSKNYQLKKDGQHVGRVRQQRSQNPMVGGPKTYNTSWHAKRGPYDTGSNFETQSKAEEWLLQEHAKTNRSAEGSIMKNLILRIRELFSKPDTVTDADIRAAIDFDEDDDLIDAEKADPNVGGGKVRSKIPKANFVFPEDAPDGGFPVTGPGDVEDAVSSWGRYKGPHSFAEFKKRLTRIAKSHGWTSALPAAWKDETTDAEDHHECGDECDCDSCKGDRMTKQERIKALLGHKRTPIRDEKVLGTLSDETLAALEASNQETDKLELRAAEAEKPKTPEPPKPLTEEEWMNSAPASIRTMVSKYQKAEAEQHTRLVATLKTAQSVISEDQLKTRTIEQLQELAAILKLNQPKVDYSGNMPRAAESAEPEYKRQPPPDGYRLALEKQAADKKTVVQ